MALLLVVLWPDDGPLQLKVNMFVANWLQKWYLAASAFDGCGSKNGSSREGE